MKKLAALLLALLMLTGCSKTRDMLDKAMTLRADLLACESCSFDAAITADYGDELHNFAMHCIGDNDGNLEFTVSEPESIAGITGVISAGEYADKFNEYSAKYRGE